MSRDKIRRKRYNYLWLVVKKIEQNLTRGDEDLVDILVYLGKKNIVLNIDVTIVLNVPDVGDKFPKVVPPETDQNTTAVFNDFSMSEKNSEAKDVSFRRIFLL